MLIMALFIDLMQFYKFIIPKPDISKYQEDFDDQACQDELTWKCSQIGHENAEMDIDLLKVLFILSGILVIIELFIAVKLRQKIQPAF